VFNESYSISKPRKRRKKKKSKVRQWIKPGLFPMLMQCEYDLKPIDQSYPGYIDDI
jgi:hypothetical protein